MITILTLCLTNEESIPRTALEIIAGARQLADEIGNGRVQTLLITPQTETDSFAAALLHHGTDELFIAADSRWRSHQTTPIVEMVEKFVRERKPDIVLLSHDNSGSEVGARLAFRLKVDIVTDCTGFYVEGKAVHWLKPVYGGKALARMVSGTLPQLATFRARAFEPLPAGESRPGKVERIELQADSPSPVRLVETVQEQVDGISLDQAAVVVAGGRGMGGVQGFAELESLAEVLNAAVGGSRPAADSGWIPHSRLLGQTGKIVAPELYLAFGISGAPQHMAGAGASKMIVAVNSDPEAPIFKMAHLGLVDEWQNIVPELTAACREMRDGEGS